MAEIPADITSSAAQAGYLSRDVANAREARRIAQANASNRQTKAIDDAVDVVETSDADSQVSTDSEGAGSQGRAYDGEPESEPETSAENTTEGITRDDDGQLHLDLEA